MAKAGDCFWIETNHDQDGYIAGHLVIVVLDPEEFTKRTIIVPVTTLRSQKQDQTTILDQGDHEFIKHRSFINYGLAKIRSMAFIEELIKSGKGKAKDPIGDVILSKVSQGIRKSPHTPQEVVTMYGYYMMRQIPKK